MTSPANTVMTVLIFIVCGVAMNSTATADEGKTPPGSGPTCDFAFAPRLKWKIENPGTRKPVIWDNKAYLCTRNKILQVDLRTGAIATIMKYVGGDTPPHDPIVANGVLYFLVEKTVHALDIASNKTMWEHQLNIPEAIYSVSLQCVEGKCVVAAFVEISEGLSQGLGIFCFDVKSGKQAWQFLRISPCNDEILFANQKFVVYGYDDKAEDTGVICFDLNTGQRLWMSPSHSPIKQTDGKTVYDLNVSRAIDVQTGKTIWEQNIRQTQIRALHGSEIVAMEADKGIAVFDGATGKLKRRLPVFGKGAALIVVMDDILMGASVGSENRQGLTTYHFSAYDILDGKELWKLGGSQEYMFALALGTVGDGYLVASTGFKEAHEVLCFEDPRYADETACLIFSPTAVTDEEKAAIGKNVKALGDTDFKVRKAAQDELAKLGLKVEDALKDAVKNGDAEVASAAQALLEKMQWLKQMRDYIAEYHPERDPLYITKLVRHTADLAIQQKAIDRLKKITGQDFGLKPSAEWVKDQKEASDKYDAWWQTNRDKLKWSDKDDKYIVK